MANGPLTMDLLTTTQSVTVRFLTPSPSCNLNVSPPKCSIARSTQATLALLIALHCCAPLNHWRRRRQKNPHGQCPPSRRSVPLETSSGYNPLPEIPIGKPYGTTMPALRRRLPNTTGPRLQKKKNKHARQLRSPVCRSFCCSGLIAAVPCCVVSCRVVSDILVPSANDHPSIHPPNPIHPFNIDPIHSFDRPRCHHQ